MKKRKILFLGEASRADAQTWMNGLKEFGEFEIVTWEMKEASSGWRRMFRFWEFLTQAPSAVRKMVRMHQPDMVIAERTTSFGFLAAVAGMRPIAVAQQGITDLYPPGSPLIPIKKILQQKAFKRATLIHAWGPIMAESMKARNTDMSKVWVMPKGIDLRKFTYAHPAGNKNGLQTAIVTRSLTPDYRHDIIIEAAALLKQRGVLIKWIFVGDGFLRPSLEELAKNMGVDDLINFKGRIPNYELPQLLRQSFLYVSMPVSEGVSSSLFEAMAAGCFPLVTDLPGNRSWIKNGENGFLIEKNNAAKLADAVQKVAADPNTYFTAVEANRRFVEANANFETNMKLIAAKYHELIDAVENNSQ